MAISYDVYKGASDGKIHKETISRADLARNEVLVRIEASGVCGTDEHMRHTNSALGHEGVGTVEQVGKEVYHIKAGDRVGIGYARGGCGFCSECLLGYHFYCTVKPNNYGADDLNTATWASHCVLGAERLAKIPDSIPTEAAGPLMCAGQTVWLPLARTDVRPWHTVGIVGMGGLGHLAIQFAAKMGCEVVVFSGTDSKREEALALGASSFYTAADLKRADMRKGFVNHLLVTTSELPDWAVYAPVMANHSHVFPLTITTADIKINAFTLVTQEIAIHGLCSSTMTQVNDMLAFAARHNIRPIIEKYPFSLKGIEEAMAKLAAGKVRYRAVLTA